MRTSSIIIKYSVLTILFIVLFVSTGKCQDDEEYEEDTYDEELGDGDESTTTRRSRPRRSTTTISPPATGRNVSGVNGSSTVRIGAEATTRVSVPTPASALTPAATRATVRTTTPYEYEDDEVTTEEEGYGYVFRPLNNLIDNIVAGNVTGIVDNALSIRTPPEIRQFVNNVMANVFGAGIGSALKQFMPSLFSTLAPPTTVNTARDPIPTESTPVKAVIQEPIPQIQAVITGRNSTDEVKSTKSQQPLQLAFTHPGAPASRLRCEVIS